MSLKGKHIVSISQFGNVELERLFAAADDCLAIVRGERTSSELTGKVLINLFFEPSTRTRLSFGSAFLRLGGYLESTVGMNFSSMAKGESLEDTIAVLSGYADVLVLRHPEKGAAARAARVSTVPVINAGDGPGEHPTQALLDVYTLRKERGDLQGLKVALIGDLKYGRTVHSLARLLATIGGVKLCLASPESLAMPDDILEELRKSGLEFQRTSSIEEAVEWADVAYVTRLQQERFTDPAEAARLIGSYVVNRALLERTNRLDITLMHPLPRLHDLSPDVDDLPGAAYFRQAHYGVPVRMALFRQVLG